jgi:hypothetical protein
MLGNGRVLSEVHFLRKFCASPSNGHGVFMEKSQQDGHSRLVKRVLPIASR